MKSMTTILAFLTLAGCGESDREVQVHWVIERQGRSPKEIQADLDVMSVHGWYVREDNDLEQSGHYIYFGALVRMSERTTALQRIKAALEEARSRK